MYVGDSRFVGSYEGFLNRQTLLILLTLPLWILRLCIGVEFGHKIFAQTWPKVWVTFGVLCVHIVDGHICSIEVHASRWEILDPWREVYSLKFESVIQVRVIVQWVACCMIMKLSWCIMLSSNALFVYFKWQLGCNLWRVSLVLPCGKFWEKIDYRHLICMCKAGRNQVST